VSFGSRSMERSTAVDVHWSRFKMRSVKGLGLKASKILLGANLDMACRGRCRSLGTMVHDP
jgi:hypothetical protein